METISYKDLFFTFFKINAITFGGGYTIVPIIKEEFSTKRGLITEDDMLDIVAVAQSGPGAMAISTSLLTGYKLRGKKGALVSIVASVLPPLITITIIYYFYEAFANNFWVRSALRGMSGIISAVLVVSVYSLAKPALKKHPMFSASLMILSFLVSWFTSINTAFIILSLALIGLVTFSFFNEEDVK